VAKSNFTLISNENQKKKHVVNISQYFMLGEDQ